MYTLTLPRTTVTKAQPKQAKLPAPPPKTVRTWYWLFADDEPNEPTEPNILINGQPWYTNTNRQGSANIGPTVVWSIRQPLFIQQKNADQLVIEYTTENAVATTTSALTLAYQDAAANA